MTKKLTIQDEIKLCKNIKSIHRIIYAWSKVVKDYPITIRNAETGDQLDAWRLVLKNLQESIRIVEDLHPGARTCLDYSGEVTKIHKI